MILSTEINMKKSRLLELLRRNGFSERIVEAFGEVKRENYVFPEFVGNAYDDVPLPIGHRQTISQPYTIAFMLDLLDIKNKKQKILEIGSGSGYVLELLSRLNSEANVVGVERIKELADASRKRLKNFVNARVICGSVYDKIGDEKFDRILASASFDEIPHDIVNKNLEDGGIMVVPVRDSIVVVNKFGGENKIRKYGGFSFVPIVR